MSSQIDLPTPVLEPPQVGKGCEELCFRPFDQNGTFILAAQGREVRRLAVRGAGATSLAQIFGTAIQIISTLVLARLLTPADFGLVAMVTTFSLLAMNAGGNGFTEAVLQRQEMDHSLASNLFWINTGTGLVLTVVFAAAGSLMARFYGNPHVAQVAVGMSLTILITSASVLHLALLMRDMRFPHVYANQILARITSISVSILLAWAGWGYWALVVGAVAQPLCECIGAWTLCRWIPGRPRRMAGTGSMVSFALSVYGRFSFNYFTRNVDNVLIGWRFNAQALGFYKKAYDLFAFSAIMQSFTPVAVSALSRLRNDMDRYKRHLLRTLSVWALLGMGVGGVLTLVGKDLIRVLLGPQWAVAGEIFAFFGPGFGVMFIYGIHGWIHLSIGRPGRWFQWGVLEFSVTALLFLLGLSWGPVGIAAASSLAVCLLAIPALWYAGRPIELGVAPVIGAIWKNVAAAVFAAFGAATIMQALPFFAPALDTIGAAFRLLKTSCLFGGLYIMATIILHRGCSPLSDFLGLVREVMPWGRTSKASTVTAEAANKEAVES